MGRDAVGYQGGGWNLYEYVVGRATNNTDPFGEEPVGYFTIALTRPAVGDGLGRTGALIRWKPPLLPEGVHGPALDFRCTQVRLIQIAKTTRNFLLSRLEANPWRLDDSIGTGIATDWVAGSLSRGARRGVPGTSPRYAEIDDLPGQPAPWRTLILVQQEFETCAVCIGPQNCPEFNKVLGCVRWAHLLYPPRQPGRRKDVFIIAPVSEHKTVGDTDETYEPLDMPATPGAPPTATWLTATEGQYWW